MTSTNRDLKKQSLVGRCTCFGHFPHLRNLVHILETLNCSRLAGVKSETLEGANS